MVKPKFKIKSFLIEAPAEGLFKIHVEPESQRQDGAIAIGNTKREAVDHVFDINNPDLQWPIGDAVVDAILVGSYLCKLDGFGRFFLLDECWRILKEKAQLTIICPARGSNHSLMDPFYKWPPVTEDFFYFANQEWREQNGYSEYPIHCNYNWTYGFAIDQEVQTRNEEFQRLALKFGRNAAHNIHVTLTKEPLIVSET
jgi:hypothetical protein